MKSGRNRWFVDSPLEGNGFELLVPRETGKGFEASSEFGADRPFGAAVSSEQSSASAKPIERFSAARGAHPPPHESARAVGGASRN